MRTKPQIGWLRRFVWLKSEPGNAARRLFYRLVAAWIDARRHVYRRGISNPRGRSLAIPGHRRAVALQLKASGRDRRRL